jgi:Protein of unknown function (DUF2488)
MKYYFALATKEFWFDLEAVEEVLRERTHYYNTNSKQIDFWIIEDPAFLNSYKNELEKLTSDKSTKKLVAIVSTDNDFIYWLKLRYQNVISGHFNGPSKKIPQPLAFSN